MSVIGKQGKSYGLVLKPNQHQQQKPKLAPSIFAEDEDEAPKSVNEALKQEAERKKQTKKATMVHNSALAEDPTAFDYDGVYDSMKKQTVQQEIEIKASKLNQKQPKYIAQILEAKKSRDREDQIIQTRKFQREKEKDADMFGDKEMFMTSAYKKQLEANKLWEEQEKKREAAEDITKKSDLTGLYSHLLNAYSADKEVVLKKAPESKQVHIPSKTSSDKKTTERGDARGRKDEKRDHKQDNQQEALSDEKKTKTTSKSTEPTTKTEPITKTDTAINTESTPKQSTEPKTADKRKEEKISEEEAQKKLARKTDDQAIADAKARYLARKAAMNPGAQ